MSIQKAEMSVEQIENGQYVEQVAYPFVEYDHVTMENGMDIMSMIRDDVSTPTVTHDATSWRVGQGDGDVSESIVDSSVAIMTIKGQTYQNILPSPSLRNSMTNGKTMQKLNEGYDSVSTVDGVCKSAILSGQTLVNLIDLSRWGEQEKITFVSDGTSKRIEIGTDLPIKPNTKYLTIIPIYENTINNNFTLGGWDYYTDQPRITVADGTGIIKIIKTTKDVFSGNHFYLELWQENTSGQITFGKPMLIEYQEGMENWDIPYFEGMQSVRMPALTTTGKNLWDDNWAKGLTQTSGNVLTGGTYDGFRYNNNLISVDGISTIYLKHFCPQEGVPQSFRVGQYGKDKEWLNKPLTVVTDGIFNIPSDCKYIRVHVDLRYNGTSNNTSDSIPTMMVVSASKITDYEPYKTNILTVNEPIELRGIGDVKDELNLLTGEVVERTGEIVLNGNESWKLRATTTDVLVFNVDDVGINSFTDFTNSHKKMLCDKFVCGYYENNNVEFTCCRANGKGLLIGILKSRLSTPDIEGLKAWLSSNNVTVQYQLANEQIKTVGLSILDQDNQPTTQLNSFANGYIQVSSQGLIPSVDYEVPTSNSYHVDLMKPNTQYTMKNMQGTFTIDNIQYNASVNGTFTSPSTLSNKLMITNMVQTQPMLLEGDMTSKEVPYVEGIKSAFEGADKVEIVSQNADNTLSNTTLFQLSNPLRSLPNGVRDEIVLDRVNHKAKIIQRVGEDLTQLETPIVTEVNLEGYPYVYKGGHIFLNTEIAPITEVTYSINQAHQIESSNEDILRHQKEINHLYELIAQYVQVQYEAELIDIALQG